MSLSNRLLACLLLGASALPLGAVQAADYQAGDIRIERPWARATPGQSRIGAAYFTLEDVGAAPDRLIAIETPVAAAAELHTHMLDGNVMQMRPVGAIEVHPGEPTVLQPGGLHVMLVDLKAPLKTGDRFAMTLTFEHAGRVEIMVPVERAGARGPGEAGGDMPAHRMPHGS
jgi:periplasmic copper chaperone A